MSAILSCVSRKGYVVKELEPISGVSVSLIVPVFNAEEYLPQFFACLDAQVLRDFEVVIVDDGSSDGSLVLLENYAALHENVVLIRQGNKGAGAARNVALEQARGEYVVFIDADDVFSPIYLSSVYVKAKQESADIVVLGVLVISDGTSITSYPRVCDTPGLRGRNIFSWRDAPERVLSLSGMQATWSRMYRRSFLLEKNLLYPEVATNNDWPFSVLAILQAERIAWLRETPYIHVRRLDNDSITAKKRNSHMFDVFEACEFVLQGARQLPHYEHIRSGIWHRIGYSIFAAVAFYNWGEGANDEMRDFIERVPDFLHRLGMLETDMEAIARQDATTAGMLQVLCKRSVREIEDVLSVPFVLALYAEQLGDVLPLVEVQRYKRLGFSFSSIDIYVPSNISVDKSDIGVLADELESGWLRVHQLQEGAEGSWFVEAIANNPHAHCVLGNAHAVGSSSYLDHFVTPMLAFPNAAVAASTRTVFLRDGTTIEPDLWMETAVVSDGASANLWVDTSGYYLIPCGVLDNQKAKTLYTQMPPVAHNHDEYVLNGVLQGCGVLVATRRGKLPHSRKIGGSGHIKDIEDGILEWIETNRAFGVEDSAHGGYTREQYWELLAEQFEYQHEQNRHQLAEARGRMQTLQEDIARYRNASESIDSLADSIVIFGASFEELLQSRAVQEAQELRHVQCRMSRLQDELDKIQLEANTSRVAYPEKLPFSVGTEDCAWDWGQRMCIEIPVSDNNYNYFVVLQAEPSFAYRVVVTMTEGNASGAELRLWDSEKQSEMYRKYVPKGDSIEFAFAVLPEAENVNLLVYPEGIGKTAGFSATIRAEIQTASVDRMRPAISIIIPMHNCSEYVAPIITMLENQTFADFEAICVIDGATDDTADVVKRFSEKDLRIKCVVLQENSGPGEARNTGIDMARGRYIAFWDADDYYSPDYLKRLYDAAERFNGQIVICRYKKHNVDTPDDTKGLGFDVKTFKENTVYANKDINQLFTAFGPRVAHKLFATDFIKEHDLRFPETKMAEDVFFSYASLSVADRILVIHDTLHTYNVHSDSNSLTGNRSLYQHHTVEMLRELYGWLKAKSIWDIYGEEYFRRVNASLIFNERKGTTTRYVSDFAHMLNAEEPWKSMTSKEVLKYLEEGVLASNSTANLLRQLSLIIYGRDLEKEDSLPIGIDSKTTPICMIADENYLLPTMVTIQSLFANTPEGTYHKVIVILSGNISKEHISLFEMLSCEKGKVHVLLMPEKADDNRIKTSDRHRHVSNAALYKFELPVLLRPYDRALYLDSDLIIKGDISSLLQSQLENKYAAAVESFSATIYVKDLYENLGVKHYFNTGVMLLNLARMRREEIGNILLDYRLNGWNYFVDQDSFNAVFHDEVLFLPPWYNLQYTSIYRFSPEEMGELYNIPTTHNWDSLFEESVIFHYASNDKPWKYNNVWKGDLWHSYYSQLPNSIKEHFPLQLGKLRNPKEPKPSQCGETDI